MKRFATWFKEGGYILITGALTLGFMLWFAWLSNRNFNAFHSALMQSAKVSVGR